MKKLLLTALAITAFSYCFADDVPALKINKSNGESNIALSELLSIKYTESDMIVNMKDGTKQSIPLDDIIVMELGKIPTSINSIIGDMSNGETYSITDIEGKKISNGNVKEGISLPNQKGIYVITVGEKSKKVLVK